MLLHSYFRGKAIFAEEQKQQVYFPRLTLNNTGVSYYLLVREVASFFTLVLVYSTVKVAPC